jgi:hypothetical protein
LSEVFMQCQNRELPHKLTPVLGNY